jgi:branched-chain amino acid transport system ATP-binding protein
MALLELKDVHTYYGAVHALRGVSLKVEEGEIVTLIGSNGAGKTTTLRTISGLEQARSGSITLSGTSIEAAAPHDIVKMGVGHSPEGRRVFSRMSVRENLEMGAFLRKPGPEVQADFKKIFDLFPRVPGCRNDVRGRAADARDRSGADGAAKGSPP